MVGLGIDSRSLLVQQLKFKLAQLAILSISFWLFSSKCWAFPLDIFFPSKLFPINETSLATAVNYENKFEFKKRASYLNYPLEDLSSFSDAITTLELTNVSYMYPKAVNKSNFNPLWANLAIVLDNILDKRSSSRLALSQGEEYYLDNFNEAQANYNYLTVMKYLLYRGHQLTGKAASEEVNIIINLSREQDSAQHLAQLKQMLISFLKTEKISDKVETFKVPGVISGIRVESLNTSLIFRHGNNLQDLVNLSNSNKPNVNSETSEADLTNTASSKIDIVLLIDIVHGFKEQRIGKMLLPRNFVPFDVNNMELKLLGAYSQQNILADKLNDLVGFQCCYDLEFVNENYRSRNPQKSQQKAGRFEVEDIINGGVLLSMSRFFRVKEVGRPFKIKY